MHRLFLLFLLAIARMAVVDAAMTDHDHSNKQTASLFDQDSALAYSQAALSRQVRNVSFTNSVGNEVSLSEFRGKPLVISMIYTSCYHICPMTTQHLLKVVDKARQTLGEDSFEVALVGFDSRVDNSSAMRYFADQQGVPDDGWHLLSISEAELETLSKDTGFLFQPTSNGFDHVIQATVLDAEGRVYRQVYGQVFATPLLVDPLIELVLGRSGPSESMLASIGKKIKLFCTTYDPIGDGYYFDYSLFLGMLIGGSIIAYTVFTMIRELRRS